MAATHTNWQFAVAKRDPQGAYEVPIFTDARILGMVLDGYGPYRFVNTATLDDEMGTARPAIVVRVERFGKFELPDFQKTNEAGYHAGWLDDELAAVISLCLGIRAQAGDRTRVFGVNDPTGLPCGIRVRPNPTLPPFQTRAPVLPSVLGGHNLDLLLPFKDFLKLSPEAAIAVIRSARLFQQGLWIAESDPNLAWIMLSSAVETAANYWRSIDDTPADRLRAWNAKLADRLNDVGGPEFLNEVAREIAPVTGATKKFLDFLLTFCPDPPERRPPPAFQLDWSKKNLKAVFSKVYSYRSRALHVGTPFPAPMGWSPMCLGGITGEKLAGAAGAGIFTWNSEDLPLQLQTFEYIVRNALLRWWQTLPRTME